MKKTVSVVPLGCPKNLVDSEAMVGRLLAAGFDFSPAPDRADVVILNTCGFLRSACREAEEEIDALSRLKKGGKIETLVVAGCLVSAAEKKDEKPLPDRFPQVDFWFGPFDEGRLVETLRSSGVIPGKRAESAFAGAPLPVVSAEKNNAEKDSANKDSAPRLFHHPNQKIPFEDSDRFLLTLPHVAYLKIADGCDRFCSYCAIPNIRGRFVSKPLDAIRDEARRLADFGVRELVLVAQETNFWGSDLGGRPRLAELLTELKRPGDFDWIRVLYSYPLHFDDDLIDLFGFKRAEQDGESPVLPYIDLPLQHASDKILKKMNRRVGHAATEELLARLRERIPELVLRTTFITGFPGETEDDFAELTTFVRRWKFERAGVFAFSPEAGTPAASYSDPVPAEVAQKRFDKLYRLTEKGAADWAKKRVGSQIRVLIDRPMPDESGNLSDDFWLGRSWSESPDIDPVVYVTGSGLAVGEFADVEVVASDGLDLIAAVSGRIS